MNNLINIIKRFYIVCIALWMTFAVGFVVTYAEPGELVLGMFNALITIPVGAYVFYRIVRYVSFGR